MLNSGGRPHAFAAHLLCLTYLLQQISLLLQQLLIFLRHCADPLFFLKANREEGNTSENSCLAQSYLHPHAPSGILLQFFFHLVIIWAVMQILLFRLILCHH